MIVQHIHLIKKTKREPIKRINFINFSRKHFIQDNDWKKYTNHPEVARKCFTYHRKDFLNPRLEIQTYSIDCRIIILFFCHHLYSQDLSPGVYIPWFKQQQKMCQKILIATWVQIFEWTIGFQHPSIPNPTLVAILLLLAHALSGSQVCGMAWPSPQTQWIHHVHFKKKNVTKLEKNFHTRFWKVSDFAYHPWIFFRGKNHLVATQILVGMFRLLAYDWDNYGCWTRGALKKKVTISHE